MRLLLLGGTAEARALADLLVADGVDVVSSLAGRVARPRLPAGEVRIGGFGGVAGLRAEVEGYDAVVDATHPFAATISASAAEVCASTGVPLLRLSRPGWADLAGASRWHWVDTHDEAAAVAARLGGPVLLTTGRQSLDRFVTALSTSTVVARVVDAVDVPLPQGWVVLRSRGPYDAARERELMTSHRIRVLVSKDSGGDLTRAKLDVADELGVAVVLVRRPAEPAGVASVAEVAEALGWVRSVSAGAAR